MIWFLAHGEPIPRFVTTGVIDLKFCTHLLLGQRLAGTKFGPDLILGLATRGPKPKSAITPEVMAGSAPNYYHRYV
jgi:hypothetical protein